VKEILVDCDGDALVVKIDQRGLNGARGSVCNTGMRSARWLALLMVVGLALRVARLGEISFWLDEGYTLAAMRQPVLGAKHFYPLNPNAQEPIHPSFYYALLRGWCAASESEFMLRLFSALVGVLTIGIACGVGRRLGGDAVGMAAAVIIAVNPFHVYYSREARMYALLMLLVLMQMYALHVALTSGRARWFAGYVALTWMALNSQFIGGEALAAGMLYCLLRWSAASPATRRAVALSHLSLLIICAPAFGTILFTGGRSRQFPLQFSADAAMWGPLGMLTGFTFNSAKLALPEPATFLAPLGTLLVFVFIVRGLTATCWTREVRQLLVCYGLMTFAGSWFVATFTPFVEPKNWSPLFPVYLLLMAAGMVSLAQRFWPVGVRLSIALLILMSAGLLPILKCDYRPDWRGAFTHIRDQWRDGDFIVTPPFYHAVLDGYFREAPMCEAQGTELLDRQRRVVTLEELQRKRRVWAVYRHPAPGRGDDHPNSSLRQKLLPLARHRVEQRDFFQLRVYRYEFSHRN